MTPYDHGKGRPGRVWTLDFAYAFLDLTVR